HFRGIGTRVQLRVMVGFSLTAAAGIIGVQILYNQDVILAEHYLNSHAGGIYGGLNKIGTILYFLTLSVSQVLFPRVVEAVAKEEHPGRILLYSAGLLTLLGAGALLVFGVVADVVVTLVALLLLLSVRCYLLLPTLRASSLDEAEPKPALG